MQDEQKPFDIDMIVGLGIQADAIEFIELLQVYVEISRGLEIDEKEIKDQVFYYVAGDGCYGQDRADRVWQALTELREELIELRNKWRERFEDLEEDRNYWDYLDLDMNARVKSAMIGEPEGEA